MYEKVDAAKNQYSFMGLDGISEIKVTIKESQV
jgi:hypothetical protein